MHTDHYFYVGTENEQGQNTVFETDSDKSGKITAIEDKVGNYHRYYTYDFLDRLSKRSTVKTGLTIESQFTYDYNERPLSKNVLINNVSTDQTTIHYKSDIDDTVSYITHTAVGNENFTYDALKRVNSYKLAMPGMEKAVVYAQKGERTSDRIKKETTVLNNVVDNTISYGYNNNKGNLTEVFVDNELINRYFYDGFGRIIREDNRKLSFTKLYFYDENGNILERREYAFTLGSVENASYTSVMYGYRYDKGDRLQSYAGESCTYNAMGYPTVYRSKTLTWSMVKHLASFDDVTYTYDYQGVRMTKTADNVTHNYLTDDGKLIEERFGENTLKYYYGAQGILGFDYNGTKYFYVKNMLGDVIALVDASGIVVARYAYDAWGNHKVFNPDGTENTSASFIGNVNPIRYRGYYFDEETGLYYLKTRYYDPQVGRFISPDSIEYLAPSSVSGLNLYAYCNNNPVMYTDESGEGILTAILIGALIGVIIGGRRNRSDRRCVCRRNTYDWLVYGFYLYI